MSEAASTPAHGALRAARSGALGGAALALAAGAHSLAGGTLPAPGRLAFLAFCTVAVVLVATTRRLRTPALLLTLAGLQAALHTGFLLLAPGGSAVVTTGAALGPAGAGLGPAAHAHHGAVAVVVAGGDGHGSHLAMLALHVVATLLTAVLLARGEALVWLLASIAVPVVARLVAAAVRLRRPLPLPLAPVDVPRLHQQHWALAAPRRGPPVLG